MVEAMRINSTGNVGIGTTSPGAKLDIGAGASARGSNTDLLIGAGGNVPQIELYHTSKSAAINYDGTTLSFYTNGGSWAQGIAIDNSGYVGIGSASPADLLDVQGGNIRNSALAGGGTLYVQTNDSGQLIKGPASDIRLKTNVVPITNSLDVLGALDQLHGVYFDWDQSKPEAAIYGSERQLGLIAQDVQRVLPELVTKNNNGYLMLNYPQLSAYLVEVAKAQKAEIEQLKSKDAELEARLAALEKKMSVNRHPEAT